MEFLRRLFGGKKQQQEKGTDLVIDTVIIPKELTVNIWFHKLETGKKLAYRSSTTLMKPLEFKERVLAGTNPYLTLDKRLLEDIVVIDWDTGKWVDKDGIKNYLETERFPYERE